MLGFTGMFAIREGPIAKINHHFISGKTIVFEINNIDSIPI